MKLMTTMILGLIIALAAHAGVDPQNTFTFGDGTTGANKSIRANKSTSSTKPQLRYNVSTSKWEVSHDGITFTVVGGSPAVNTYTANQTLTTANSVVMCNGTTTITQTLFLASSAVTPLFIKDLTTYPCIFKTQGTDTIEVNGIVDTSATLYLPGESAILFNDGGTQWHLFY